MTIVAAGQQALGTVCGVKVVAASAWYPNERNGSIGTFVEKDVHAIARDHEVEVVHLVAPSLHDGGPRTEVQNGITVHRVPMSPSNLVDAWRAGRALRPYLDGADVVHTMAFPTLLPFAGGRPAAPWVHTEHWSGLTNPSTLPAAWRAALPILRRLLAKPDVITSVCEYLAAPIRGARTGPVTIVPCIVPPVVPLVDRPERGDQVRLIGVGGLIERKDPLLALATLGELRRRGVDASLTWVGDGPLRQQLEESALEQGLADRLVLTGPLGTAGVSAALSQSDLFLLPTRADNFCVSAAEAIVHGRPVVVGSTGGQGEYITDQIGALVDHQDAGLYADAVLSVLDRTSGLSAAEIAGVIGDRFSEGTVAAGYDAAYRLAVEVRDADRA